ncbi:MAG: DUF2892 domain-containing protein [Methylocystaceae bacterium]|nr:DUF2892 domain-containing protein [Methylocystaceae bacterium]
MTKNVGSIDKILRIIVGLVLLAYGLGFIAPGTGYNAWGFIGIVPIVTALLGWCPAYTLIGLNTCPANKD